MKLRTAGRNGEESKVRKQGSRPLPELLAPAGGMEQLRAAVQNGADAVYMGGSLFNARMRAHNFGEEEMRAAVEYAHKRDVRLYVTLNTLIRDDELFKAFSYGQFLYSIGVDALIIQDLGLGHLFHRFLPEMPLHLSTQATIYNPQAVPLMKSLGYSRIVPARELTLEELTKFAAECHRAQASTGEDGSCERCEVEVFVHGALCMCYSGQCQMSRMIGGAGGRSGNRGLCAQPCRLPYTDDRGRTGYFLSPKDLCLVDHIPELCRAGADSFKIEGRMKSAEYVAVVTSVYRKYLDQYAEEGSVTVSETDHRRLEQIFSRGGSTAGYLFGDPGEALLSGDSPKHRGIFVGRVDGVRRSSPLVDVRREPGEDIAMGDGIEIRGKGSGGNVVTYRQELPRKVLRVGDIRERVFPGDRVYRVTSKALLEEARASYAEDRARTVPVSMEFTGYTGTAPVLDMICGGLRVRIAGDQPLEQARDLPATEARVAEQLGRLGGTVYRLENTKIRIGEDVMIPKSLLNRLRRQASEEMDRRRAEQDRRAIDPGTLRAAEAEIKKGLEEDALAEQEAVIGGVQREDIRRLSLREFMKRTGAGTALGSGQVPCIEPVTKGALDAYIEGNFPEICRRVSRCGLLIGNPGWLRRFVDAGVPVYGDEGLNVYNSQSRQLLRQLGVIPVFDSPETVMDPEAGIPLMILEHRVPFSRFTDRKGVVYEVRRSSGGKSVIRKAPKRIWNKTKKPVDKGRSR